MTDTFPSDKSNILQSFSERSEKTDLVDGLRFILWAFLRWLFICLPIGLILGSATAIAFWHIYEPTFKATSWIKIDSSRDTLAFTDLAKEESKLFADTQIQLMRSPLVIGEALKVPAVAELSDIKNALDPVEWLTERVTVRSVGRSELYVIEVEGNNAGFTFAATNAIVDAYMNFHAQRDSEELQQTLELLEQERERWSKEIERLSGTVRHITSTIFGHTTPLISNGSITSTDENLDEMRLVEIETDRQILEARLRAMEKPLHFENHIAPTAASDHVTKTEALLVDQYNKLKLLQSHRNRILQISTKGELDPRVLKTQKEIDQINDEIETLLETRQQRVIQDLEQAERHRRQKEIAELKQEIHEKTEVEELFRDRKNKNNNKQEGLEERLVELEFARSELERCEQVHSRISYRATALRTEMRAQKRVSIVQRARLPKQPVDDGPVKTMIFLFATCLAVPFALAFGWEMRIQRIIETEQVSNASNVAMIGEIAALPARNRRLTETEFQRDQNVYDASVNSVCTSLNLSDQLKDVKVINVASAISSEGKSSLSSQLAVGLARVTSEPTLLIDADLRKPDLHEIFQISNEVGLVDVLDGKSTIEKTVVTDWHEHLHLLPAGRCKISPHTLLGNGSFEALLHELRGSYRYIIIDAAPVLLASESLILAKAADGTVLCAMKDRTRFAQIRLLADRLSSAGVTILGAVLTGVKASDYYHKYGGEYNYGGADYISNENFITNKT